MISLSYSTMNALINEPHTWVNKQMGLKTFRSKYMEDGLAAHKIIQEHVSGAVLNDLLKDLPLFSVVEKVDFDEDCKVTKVINDKYIFTGFVDGLNPKKGEMLEIKSGRRWSPGDFKKLVQWKLYLWAKPEYKKIWLVNVPGDTNLWMPETIRVFNTTVTDKDIIEAEAFIQKAIYVIEHIKEYELHQEKRSSWCYYQECSFCPQDRN